MSANNSITKVYTDSSSTKYIKIKVQLNNGNYLYCHSSVDVFVTNNGTANRYAGNDQFAREVDVPVVAGEGLGGDVMQIRYSVMNPTRTSANPHLRKPLIYVEGYDVSGKYNILKLISNDIANPGEWVDLAAQYDFMNYLDDIAGYDLVFINYNTLRSFEDNSKMLQHVIEWVKADKTAGGYNNPNVIIGVSAGGVLARYTLAKMTKTISSASTDTRLLITHDSPHQGTNVPLAFQHFLYDLGEQKILGNKIKDKLDDLKNFYALNLEPATAQLLKARVVSQGVIAFNTFLNGAGNPYQQMVTFSPSDNPPTYNFIATAQGSQCGIPVMPSDGLSLADMDDVFSIVNFKSFFLPSASKTKYFLKTQLNALPSSGVSQIEYFKFSRRFSITGVGLGTRTINEYSRTNPIGYTKWDAAPGSTQSIDDRANGALITGLDKQDVPWYATPYVKVRAGLKMNITQDLFSFVSTISALDAPANTALNTPYIFPVNGTASTATQTYIAQESYAEGGITRFNKNHTDYTARNAQWIYEEMENITHPFDCKSVCSDLAITGPNNICTTGSFIVTGVPPGATVIWSSSNTNIATVDPVGAVTVTGNGQFILTATVQECPMSKSITLTTGAQPLSSYSIFGATQVVASANYHYSLTYPFNILTPNNISWRVPSGWTINSGQGTTSIYVTTGTTGGAVEVDFDNTCGQATGIFKTVTVGSGGPIQPDLHDNPEEKSFTISPNPSTGSVEVKLNTKDKKAGITEIRIKNKMGTVVFGKRYSAGEARKTLNLSLPADIYFVEIFDGKQWSTEKLSIH